MACEEDDVACEDDISAKLVIVIGRALYCSKSKDGERANGERERYGESSIMIGRCSLPGGGGGEDIEGRLSSVRIRFRICCSSVERSGHVSSALRFVPRRLVSER